MADSSIEWTEKVWNPVRGCSLVSDGCRSCYAMKQAHRFSGPGGAYEGFTRIGPNGPTWTGKVELIEDKLLEPLSWRKPRKVFVNSMSDLFHEALSDEVIDRVFAVMALAPQHIFQVLTKRVGRMRDYLQSRSKSAEPWKLAARTVGYAIEFNGTSLVPFPLPNVWLGVSVENQHFADERIPLLLDTPAAVRFISAEPLLGRVDLQSTLWNRVPELVAKRFRRRFDESTDVMSSLFGLDWVIIGGESGPGARTFHVNWARDIVKQCAESGVACFVKQLGDAPQFDRDETLHFVRSRKGGDIEEFPADLRVRQWPTPCAQ